MGLRRHSTTRTEVLKMIKKRPKTDQLFKHVGALGDLSSAMIALAEFAPDRMTMAQGVFFLLAASADIAGKPTTFTEIKEAQGEAINRSLHSTYRSEEHTSELQSLMRISYAVFCLKKKKKQTKTYKIQHDTIST